MKKLRFLLFLCLIPIAALAQVRVGRLIVKSNQVFKIDQSDIVVADTLIMMDSSSIQLNLLKKENYLRAQIAIFGNYCRIEGSGVNGGGGRNGRSGDTPFGPCRPGEAAHHGGRGLDGGNGVNLFLYFQEITVKGKLFINIKGGNGGNGGKGGNGGSGSPGTIHCRGGDGGDGGNGADGGNGGNGGTLVINCSRCIDLKSLFTKSIILNNNGGNFGVGGKGGYGGVPGLGPSNKNGKGGSPGMDGANGKSGEKGNLNFEIN